MLDYGILLKNSVAADINFSQVQVVSLMKRMESIYSVIGLFLFTAGSVSFVSGFLVTSSYGDSVGREKGEVIEKTLGTRRKPSVKLSLCHQRAV